MNIELIDPNELTVAVIHVTKFSSNITKKEALDGIKTTFCRLYKQWDGSPGIMKELGDSLFNDYGILFEEIIIDEEIYACR